MRPIRRSKLKKTFLTVALAAIIIILNAGHALAIPTLQLDIAGGTYDYSTQTIVANSETFTLFAYLIPDSYNKLSDTYFVSAAVKPKLGPTDSAQGSFTFNGTNVNVTDDMTYGVPPLEAISSLQGWDKGDLPTHGIYPTFFSEFGFKFSEDDRIRQYNTQDRAKSGGAIDLAHYIGERGMYYVAFNVNVTNINTPYVLHFDLYNTILKCGGDIDITQFAPFSHDAESRQVPEPSTFILLGAGLVMVLLLSRKAAVRA